MADNDDQQELPPEEIAKNAMTQAAIAGKTEGFQRWILGPDYQPGNKSANEAMAAAQIRTELGITSRTAIRDDAEKRAEWNAMWRRYEAATLPAAAE